MEPVKQINKTLHDLSPNVYIGDPIHFVERSVEIKT